jgi:hypothetical protein
MRKIFVIIILGFAILSPAQSNHPKNIEDKNNGKKVQSENIYEYQQPYKNISSTKLYSDNLAILRKRNGDSLAMDRKRSAEENLKNNQDTQLFHDRIEDKGNYLQFYDIKNTPIGKITNGTSLETGNHLIINQKYLKSSASTPTIVPEKLEVVSFKKDKKVGWQLGLRADISNFENFLLPESWQKVQSISPSIMYLPVVKLVQNPYKNESGQPENIIGTSTIVPFFMIFD